MMRKMKFFGLLLSFLLLIGTGIGLSAAFGDITVKLTYNVNNVNEEQADFSQAHGTTLTHEAPLNVGGSGEFNYWLVNGILRTDLARNLSIVTRSTTELVAVYGHPTKPTVTFIDSNGKYINHLFVESDSVVAEASVPAEPGKPQSTFAGWKGLGSSVVISDPITTNTVFIATYTENTVTAELVVDGGTPTTYPINSVVSLTLGEGFTHWEDGDGNVLSYAETFKFSMLVANRKVVRATGGVKEPVVNMIAETGLREGYTSYIGQFDSNGLDVIEYGFIISRSKDILTIDSLGATIIPSNVYNEQTNEFLRSFPEDSYNSIRAYAIFAGDVTVYSDHAHYYVPYVEGTKTTETFSAMTMSGSSYGSGSHKGVNDQIWSYTDARGDLTLDDKALLLRAGSLTTTFTNGLSNLKFDYVRAFTGGSARSYEIYINGSLIDTITVSASADERKTYDSGNLSYFGTVELEIRGIGAQKMIDNVSWTSASQIVINEPLYSVEFIDGESSITKTVFNNEFVVAPVITPEIGFRFDGWFTQAIGGLEYDITTTPITGNVTLYAKFTVNDYTLSFNTGDGGSVVDSITQNYGTAVTAPADPIKEGYTFVGWTPAIPLTMPAENQTFTAVWEANEYTVTFVTNGGSEVDSITQNFGSEITLPTTVRSGHNFNGWYSDADLTTLVESLVMPLDGITLYAGWVDASSTSLVSFMDGDSPLFTEIVTIGTPVTRPTTDPTKDGYTFNNWYSDSSLTTLYNFDSNVETNISIYAGWDSEPVLDKTIDFGVETKTGYAAGEFEANGITFTKDRAQLNTQTHANSNKTVAAILAPISTTKSSYFHFAYAGVVKVEFDVITWATGTTLLSDSLLYVQFSTDNGSNWVNSANLFSKVKTTSITTLSIEAPVGVTHIKFYYETPSASSKTNTQYAIAIDNIKLYKDSK